MRSQNLLESDTPHIWQEVRPYLLGEDKLDLVCCSTGPWFEKGEDEAPWFCQCLKLAFPSITHPDIKMPSGSDKCQVKGILYTVHLPHSMFLCPFYRSGAMRLRVKQP